MPESWELVETLFLQALDLPPEERAAFLETACAGNPELRREVESLIEHDGASEQRITGALKDTARSLLDSAAITSGIQVGDYQVRQLIGSGSMGEVYQAWDVRLARDVAIKVLPGLLTNAPDRLRRFEQEARAAAALNHPNILAIYQLGTYEGAPYLVSELLEGATLREHIKRGPLPPRIAVEYAAQIARGLAAAHEKGITHRDLKPENLFVTRDGRIKILDFGLAKLAPAPRGAGSGASASEAGMVIGTVGYMSPEQVRGEAADYRADIFAFGAILFEMLTGQRAFQKATSAETLGAILNEDPPTISQFLSTPSPALQRVVQRCLEKNRDQRFQSASDLAFALEALSDSGIGPTAPNAGDPRRRNTARFALAALAAAVVIALVVWWIAPAPTPRVEAVRQLTDDGEPKPTTLEAAYGSLAGDGSRVYFNEKRAGNWGIVQVAAAGGQSAPINSAISKPIIAAIHPDSSSLLTLNGWLLPVPAGNPRRLGDLANLDVTAAAYFPDGRHIVYASGPAIYVCDSDGVNIRKLSEVRGEIRWLSISHDGARIRFTLLGDVAQSIREIKADGTGQREILTGWQGADYACCGKWTKDGRYFVFLGFRQGISNIWALSEARFPFHGSVAPPVQLTNGPLSYYGPLPGADNKTIVAVGAKQKGELSRYDAKRNEFVPFLGGISATDVMLSRDGQWVVYLSYPASILWRSRMDGSDRMQLSNGRAFYPQIAPDGGQVVFVAFDPQKGLCAYIVSMQGGTPRRVTENTNFAAWSPAGDLLVFQAGEPHLPPGTEIRTLDLRTGTVRVIPDSRGKFLPYWPNPGTLAAGSPSGQELFDFKTQKWSLLATGDNENWFSSANGAFMFFEKSDASGHRAFQMRLADRSVKPVADLSGVRRVEQYGPGTWLGATPDGSILITRDIGTQELYALDVKWP